MNSFDDTQFHHALEDVLEPTPVPPLPYASIVREGKRRRRRRVTGAAASAAALVTLVGLAGALWSGASEVQPSAPASGAPQPHPSVSASAGAASLPVRAKLPTGTLHGARWALRIVDYREQGDGLYCEDWKVAVNNAVDPENNGHCNSGPMTQSDGVRMDLLDVQATPADHASAELGVLFAGNMAPAGAVTLRAVWAGGSATTPVFLLRGDVRHWFVLAIPYTPGGPASSYVTTLTFLDAHGHVVPPDPSLAHIPPNAWTIQYGPRKK